MDRRAALLLLTFFESFSTILLERGIYFYTEHQLRFTTSQNLALAFGFGVTYVLGALASHGAACRFGERRVLRMSLIVLLACHLLALCNQHATLLCIVFVATGFLHGIKWPVIESFVTAGQTPRQVVRMIGQFNVAWSTAVPPAVAIVGPMLETPWPPIVFACAAMLNLVALALTHSMAPHPTHLAADHPERPDNEQLRRYSALLGSSRWLLLGGYALMFLLAPLLPNIFKSLELTPTHATVSASLIDVTRVLTFIVLGIWAGWHGRVWPTWLGAIALAGGFLLTLLGHDLRTVLLGEMVFGAAAGVVYFTSLYYAIVVRNAAVDAGGKHEGLIGLGFALGPLVGWIGHHSTSYTGSYETGVLLGAAPLFGFCVLASLLALPRGFNQGAAERRA